MKTIFNKYVNVFLLFTSLIVNSQTQNSTPYGTIVNSGNYRDLYINNVVLGTEINQSGVLGDGVYSYYNNLPSITAELASSISGTIEFTKGVTYEITFAKIWIDFNGDNSFDFSESSTEEFDIVINNNDSNLVISESFNLPIPANSNLGVTRMRILVYNEGNTNVITPYDLNYRLGDAMDFNVNIITPNTNPIAVCQNISVDLDSGGNATITPSQINNGSTDAEDVDSSLILSLDKSTFTCDDLGVNTVTLTVTDSNGASDTCTANITVNAYNGVFEAPTLTTINHKGCSYSVTAPVMNYLCNTEITGTSNDPITFNTEGTHSIIWAFNNGNTTVYSTQNIIIANPVLPSNVIVNNINTNSANVSWSYATEETFKVRYRINNTTNTWIEKTINTKNIDLLELNDNTEYEVQVQYNSDCDIYTSSIVFTTTALNYCIPNSLGSGEYYITNITLGNIDNSTGNTSNSNQFTFYDEISTSLAIGETYTVTYTFNRPQYGTGQEVIWIDFNNNGVFENDEKIIDNTTANSIQQLFTKSGTFTVPSDAVLSDTRMRVIIAQENISACDPIYRNGETEDYLINIQPALTAPTANCISNLDVSLDVSGNATITENQINNGSSDDYDDANSLILSLSKTDFNCSDLGANIVTLTVTDSNGLTDSCNTTVNISGYSGGFEPPVLETIDAYCSYTAIAPIMNYQCGQVITASTNNTTVFNSDGNYTIIWNFDNGVTSVNANQTVNITTPVTPTNVVLSNIKETSVNLSWTSSETGPFKVRYKETSTSDWNVVNNITTTNTTLTGLNNGTGYDVQVAVDADCATYTTDTANLVTTETLYCETSAVYADADPQYFFIETVNIGSINQSSNNSVSKYHYFDDVSTVITKTNNLTGTITYKSPTWSNNFLKIWIDYNFDGDFDDSGELVYNQSTNNGTGTTTESISITIPNTALSGKTRMRVYMSNGDKTDPCLMNSQGNVQDFDLFIDPLDTSTLESAIITQVYHDDNGERWIEITNQGVNTIPAGVLSLGLFKNTSGDQTGNAPSAIYSLNSELTQGETTLVKSGGAILVLDGIVDVNITDFDGGDDIIAIISETGTTAWSNRFDVVSNILNNTSYVRNDDVVTYNNTYESSNWTAFVDDNLNAYRDLSNGGPERHPHDPLLSEISNSTSTENIKLGVHQFGSITRSSNTWINGTPDRSRTVVVNEDFKQGTTTLKARNISVTNNNKLTITNQLLLVSDEIDINSSAEIKLEGTSQLIQTHTGSKKTVNTGVIYKDRNSNTASIYRFNYLSSPVNTNNSNAFTITNVLKDGTVPTSELSNIVDINFVSGYNGSKTSPISIADYWIYTYPSNSGGGDGYVQKKSTGSITNTDGFLLKGPGVAQNYTFVGVPNDGSLITSIGADESYLVGNPYPSAISAKKFIEDNEDAITGTLYFWQHTGEQNNSGIAGHNYNGYEGGYATRNKTMGLAADQVSSNNNENNNAPKLGSGNYEEPEAYIPVGQAFFIQGDSNGGSVSFNNTQREFIIEGAESKFFKAPDGPKFLDTNSEKANTISTSSKVLLNESKTSIIKIGVDYINEEQKSLHSQLGISFTPGNTFAYDKGFDSPLFNESKTSVYWKFPDNNEKYVIAGVQEITDELEVPLEIVMGYNGELILSIDEWQDIDRDVYLKDKMTSELTKINGNLAKLNLVEDTYINRFYLVFSQDNHLSANSLNSAYVDVVFNSVLKNVRIDNLNDTEINSAAVYDIMGKQIKKWNRVNQILDVSPLSSGLYIIKVITNKGEFSKKLMIN